MSKLSSAICIALLLLPVMAVAQTGTPTAIPPRAAGAAPPSGNDTPVAPIAGTSTDPTGPSLPRVDSSGVNQSSANSATGQVMPPAGAPRLPGEPMTPPTGPDPTSPH